VFPMPTLKNNSGPEKKNPIPTKSRPVSDTGRIGKKACGGQQATKAPAELPMDMVLLLGIDTGLEATDIRCSLESLG